MNKEFEHVGTFQYIGEAFNGKGVLRIKIDEQKFAESYYYLEKDRNKFIKFRKYDRVKIRGIGDYIIEMEPED